MDSVLAEVDMKPKLGAVTEDDVDGMSDVSVSTAELLARNSTEKPLPGFVNTRVHEARQRFFS